MLHNLLTKCQSRVDIIVMYTNAFKNTVAKVRFVSE